MATYYVDFENGNDSNDGLTFETRKKSINNASTSRLPGDEIRVMRTGTSTLGNATWYSVKNIGGKTYSFSGSYASATDPGIITRNLHGFNTGDFIRFSGIAAVQYNGIFPVTKIDDNTFSVPNPQGAVGTISGSLYAYDQRNCIVQLETAVTKNVMYSGYNSLDFSTPVASANVTGARVAFNSQTNNCIPQEPYAASYNVTSTFTTGKAAYHTLPSTLDLTGYRQLSFWVRQISGSVTSATPHTSIRLCSDSTGDVTEYTFTIPNVKSTNRWQHFVVDCGVDMTTPINSVAFYVDVDTAALHQQLNSVIACKGPDDPNLLHQGSLISTGRPGDSWWPVNFINENIISIGTADANSSKQSYSNSQSNFYGYGYDEEGETYTGPLYAHHPIDISLALYGYAVNNQSLIFNNIYSNNITITGGWNSTDMSTINPGDMTWITAGQTYGKGIQNYSAKQNVTIENMGFSRFWYAVTLQSNVKDFILNNVHMCGCAYGIYLSSTSYGHVLNNCNVVANSVYGFYFGSPVVGTIVNNSIADANPTQIYMTGTLLSRFENTTIRNHQYGLRMASQSRYNQMKNVVFKNGYSARYFQTNTPYNPIKNVQIFNHNYINDRAGGTDIMYDGCHMINLTTSNVTDDIRPQIYQEKWLGVIKGTNYSNGVTVTETTAQNPHYDLDINSRFIVASDTSVTRSGTGKSLRFYPANGFGADSTYCTKYRIGTVVVTGGRTVTFSAWIYVGYSNLKDIRIGCYPQIEGISEIVYSDEVTEVQQWVQRSITVSPVVDGVLDFYVFYSGGIYGLQSYYNFWVDDIECTQV